MTTSGFALTACSAELAPPWGVDCESNGPANLICRPSMPPLALICAMAVSAPALPGLTVDASGPVRSLISAKVRSAWPPPPPAEELGPELDEQAERAPAISIMAAMTEKRIG